MSKIPVAIFFIIIIPVVIPKYIGPFIPIKDTKCICDSFVLFSTYCGRDLQKSPYYIDNVKDKGNCHEDGMYECVGQLKGATQVDNCTRFGHPCRLTVPSPGVPTCDLKVVC